MKQTINGLEYEIGPRADLHGADLRGANLREADLRGADLYGANLRWANLHVANLRGADLRGADLRWADLYGVDLHGANLNGADLREADLREADLREADLRGADLRGANLREADLRGADLRGANLRGAKDILPLASAQTLITPEGDIIGYKKLHDGTICKLRIPAEAKRHNATVRKCRAEYAFVLEGEGVSQYDPSFAYKVGETVRPREPFDDDRWNECGSGIHFFLTKIEAENY